MSLTAIYARVSSERQKEEQTIASQTAALTDHAASAGLEVPAEWIFEDEGFSGATLIRPALERLRDLVAQVEVDVVLCYSPDRLARKYAYQALLVEEFARAGTAVRFVKGPKADTPEDELLLQFQGMIAEYEKAQITERTRRGKAQEPRVQGPGGVPEDDELGDPAEADPAGSAQGKERLAVGGHQGPTGGGVDRDPRAGDRLRGDVRAGRLPPGGQQALRRQEHQGPLAAPGDPGVPGLRVLLLPNLDQDHLPQDLLLPVPGL